MEAAVTGMHMCVYDVHVYIYIYTCALSGLWVRVYFMGSGFEVLAQGLRVLRAGC